MSIIVAGVTCEEEVNRNSESFDIVSGPQATKVLICPWNSRWTVIVGLLGFNSSVSIGGGITLQLPARYPDFQQTAVSLYAATVGVEGIGQPYQNTYSVGYTSARLIVNYRSFPWSFQGISQNDFNNQIDPTHPYVYAEQNLSFTSEFITIPGYNVYWLSSGEALGNRNWGFVSPIMNMRISIKYVPYIPAAEIVNAMLAPINNATYLGVPAGKLAFRGADTNEARMSDGTLTQSIDYTFQYRSVAPWDYDYNGTAGSPGWDQVVDGNGDPIIQRSDLSGIIPVSFAA